MDDSGFIVIQNRLAQLTSHGQIHWKQKTSSYFAPSEFFPSIKPKGSILFKLASFSVGKTNLSSVEIAQNKLSVDIRHFFSSTKVFLGSADEVFLSKEGLWTLEVEITQQDETFQLSLWFFASCCIACINGYYDVFHIFA